MPVFKPDYYVSNFDKIDFSRLKRRGIRLLLCDIDNTVVAYDDPDSNAKVRRFVKRAHDAGLQVALLSNAAPARASRFAKDLGVKDVYYLSFKPLQHNFRRVMKDFGVTPKQTALVGDQLLTDMLGSNIAGVYKILTKPISQRDKWDTRINRFFEERIYNYYERRGIFKRGKFDD